MGSDNSKTTKKEETLKMRPKEKEAKKTLEAKVVLLGDPNVGKSSIAQRFCKNVFSNQHIATIGGAYLQQKVLLENGESMKLHIWDTGGQERFRAMANLYYKEAAAAILTYDITNEETLTNLNYWIDELRNKADTPNILLCLAGNKSDVSNFDRMFTDEDPNSGIVYSKKRKTKIRKKTKKKETEKYKEQEFNVFENFTYNNGNELLQKS